MTIFSCSRCGVTPGISPGPADRRGQPSVQIVHKCRNGRSYKVTFWGPDQTANQNDTIYRWNEANAGDNPNWWPERYDYLHGLCRGASPRGEAGV